MDNYYLMLTKKFEIGKFKMEQIKRRFSGIDKCDQRKENKRKKWMTWNIWHDEKETVKNSKNYRKLNRN